MSLYLGKKYSDIIFRWSKSNLLQTKMKENKWNGKQM